MSNKIQPGTWLTQLGAATGMKQDSASVRAGSCREINASGMNCLNGKNVNATSMVPENLLQDEKYQLPA